MRKEVVSPPPVRRPWLDAASFATTVVVATLCSLAVMIVLAESVDDSIARLVPAPIGSVTSVASGTGLTLSGITLDGNATCEAIPLGDRWPAADAHCHQVFPSCLPFVGCGHGAWRCEAETFGCSWSWGMSEDGLDDDDGEPVDYSEVEQATDDQRGVVTRGPLDAPDPYETVLVPVPIPAVRP